MIIEEKKPKKLNEQKLILENRGTLTVSGVENVESFSDTSVVLETNFGRLIIKGEGLHVNKLTLTDGGFSLDGKINSMEYPKKNVKSGKLIERLFK